MRSLVVSALEDLGVAACGSPRPRAASRRCAACRASDYDLIVTDINMPDINGLELVSFVQAQRRVPRDPAASSSPPRAPSAIAPRRPRARRRRLPGQALRPGAAARSAARAAREARAGSSRAWRRVARAAAPAQQGVPGVRLRGRGDPRAHARRSRRPGGPTRAARTRRSGSRPTRLFRSAHSLKGLAGMFGFEGVSELAHHLEDVLDGLRLGRLSPGLAGARSARRGRRAVRRGAGLRADEHDDAAEAQTRCTALIDRIDAPCASPPRRRRRSLAGLDLDPALLRALTEYEEHRLRENVRRGRAIHLVEASFDILSFEEGLAELIGCGARGRRGDLDAAVAGRLAGVADPLLAAGRRPNATRAALRVAPRLPDATVRGVREASRAAAARPPPGSPAPEASRRRPARDTAPRRCAARGGRLRARVAQVDQRHGARRHPQARRADEPGGRAGDPARRDRQRSPIGCWPIPRRRASAASSRRSTRRSSARSRPSCRPACSRCAWCRCDRSSRSSRAWCGGCAATSARRCASSSAAADTELDKLIVEELVDPLMHVVRNAFDHAIEPAARAPRRGQARGGRDPPRGPPARQPRGDRGRRRRPRHRPGSGARARRGARPRGERDAMLARKEMLDLIFAPGPLDPRAGHRDQRSRRRAWTWCATNVTALGGVVRRRFASPGRGTTVVVHAARSRSRSSRRSSSASASSASRSR